MDIANRGTLVKAKVYLACCLFLHIFFSTGKGTMPSGQSITQSSCVWGWPSTLETYLTEQMGLQVPLQ